jgi:dTMP kinase
MIIAIEGIDGSGKGTQSHLLAHYLQDQGKNVTLLQFPRYSETKFGREVGKYLNGDYGSLSEVHPKFSAILYALDRFETLPIMNSALSQEQIIICDRYVGSNLAHQSARVKEDEREELIDWIGDLEFNTLGIPRPDIVFFLDMAIDTAKALIAKKDARDYTDKAEDLHEQSRNHLSDALSQFRKLSEKSQWIRIPCLEENGGLKSTEQIQGEILAVLQGKKVI